MNMNPSLEGSRKLVQALEIADAGAAGHRPSPVLLEGLEHLVQGYGAWNNRMSIEMAVHIRTLLIKTEVESDFGAH